MQIYSDEHIKNMEEIERGLEQSINNWVFNLGNDFSIEARILPWGDTNDFTVGEKVVTVKPKYHYIDVKDIVQSGKNLDRVRNRVVVEVRKYLQSLIENKINASTLNISNLKDFRKCIKVVLDDIYMDADMKVVCKFGVEEVSTK